MSGWKNVKLEDCCRSISDGDHLPPPKTDSGVPFVTISDIRNNHFDLSNTRFVPEAYYEAIDPKRKIQKGDVLYSVVGSYGIPVFANESLKVAFQRHIAILRPSEEIEPRFLYYSMLNRDFFLKADAVAVGAAQKTITLSALRGLEIALPPLPTQRRIASILSDYDSAIDNARRQIALLEEAAMRLYREWFVVNADPMWEKKRIVDVCSRIGAGGTPNRRQEKYWLNGTIDWIKTKELQDCWLFDSEEKITSAGLDESSAKIYPANTVVMAIYASPTLGRLGILDKPMCCNQAALCLVADESQVSWEWLYCQLFELRDEFNRIARGAGQQNISGEVVKETVVRIPDIHAMSEFTNAARPLFSQCRSLGRQIRSLTEARNRLLPKLMSGEVEV